MPDNIETTIFKVELDGSGYIQGVDKLTESTKKLTTEQEKSNDATEKASKEQDKAAEATKKNNVEQEKAVTVSQKVSAEKEKAAESTKKLSTEQEKQVEVTKKVSIEQEKAATTTKKLSTEQEKAAKAVSDLKKQENDLKKSLEEVTAVIKANEKETLELTKRLNDLKAAGKGAGAEAKNLQAQLRGLATNTKEFRIEQSEITKKISDANVQLKNQSKVMVEAEKATGGFAKGIGKAYSGLKVLANILPGLGIAGLIGLIAGPLVSAFQKWGDELSGNAGKLSETKKLFYEVFAAASKSASDDIAKMEVYRNKLNDLSIPASERVKIAKEYNKVADETNKIDVKQIDNLVLLNAQIDKQNKLIIARALSTAALSQLNELANNAIEKDLKFREALRESGLSELQVEKALNQEKERTAKANDNIIKSMDGFKVGTGKILKPLIEENKKDQIFITESLKQTLLAKKNADFLLQQKATLLSPLITPDGLTTKDKTGTTKAAAAKKAIENVYQQEKNALDLKLKEAVRKEAEDESKIKEEFAARLKVEEDRLRQLLADKKLTQAEADELIWDARKLNALQEQKELEDRRKRAVAARQKLNDELTALQDKNMQDNLNLIQEEFERRSKLIDFNEKKELDNSKAYTEKRLAALDLERLLIGEQAYQDGKAILIAQGEQAALNIIQKFANQRKDLSSDIFQSLLQQYDKAIQDADLIRDEQTAKDIIALAEKLKAGKITYEKFQKDVKKIQKQADLDSKIGSLQVDKDKLAALDRQLAAIEDKYSESYKKLKKQRDDQASKVAKEEIALATGESGGDSKKLGLNDPRLQRFLKYTDNIGQLTESIIGFWQKANEAESKALDRSISLQEKRVEAAQRIADRGNAQYLKQEEDRLKELTVKRENAARKELGINAALQASQLLVGITGAIAKIATPGIGIAETIGAIAVIFGALSTGYGLVKSLQGNQPKLAKGSKYVTRDGNPAGIDTIPALINEGEAVIPTNTNKAYHPAVAAIYDGTIPAEHMNSFVNNYHKIKAIPTPNYERFREASELHIGENGRMAVLLSDNNRKLDEQNDIGRQTLRTLHKLGVNVSLDQHGFAVTQMEVIEQMRKNKKI